MINAFAHLQLHSEYSIINGTIRIDELIAQTKKSGMTAVALTDHMNLFGLVKFYRNAISNGIKPIIGADIVWQEDKTLFRATLLCRDQQGYKNLTELLSKAYLEGQQNGRAVIQKKWLQQYCAGLIMLSGGVYGDIGQLLLKENTAAAVKAIQQWQHYFADAFYLTLQRTGRAHEETYIQQALELAEITNVPVVATNAVCFLARDDFEAHEARTCIHASYVLDDPKRPRHYSEQQYFKSPQTMTELFSDIPEALENAAEITQRCNVTLTLGEVFLPDFPIPANITLDSYFRQQAHQELQRRLQQTNIIESLQQQKYTQRLENELDVIIKMGFAGYFLIVADFIAWSKQNDIPVGPGRGSGAGSLVAYALGITELDPLQHDLLFERFLNPERVSLPDFDVDFCMEGRDRVIEYVAQRYGHAAVAQIITYGTMAAKAVVRDVGRVLGMPYGFVDKIAKLIPFELGMTLDKALAQEAQLRERYESEEEVTTLIDLALKLEGITRNAGKHAGGVVIAPGKLTDFVPLYCEENGGHVVTQFDKDDVEAIGLVKFDFLGLRTLTIINWALKNINKKRAKLNEAPLTVDRLPIHDDKTFDLLKSCATTAVFQLESRGMKDLIRRLQPDSFEDITALVALFRPGPLQSGMVDDFIDRKHGRAAVAYPHPELEPILKPTYGVILYQEQVMQIAQVLAGYSLGSADILRRAMGKKKAEEMAKQREIFVTGATQRGIATALAASIFDLMEKFAGYGFNKSHSAAYALIAYQTAWLKAHYPAEFMAAVLSSDMDNTDKVVAFLEECKNMGLKVLPPDINRGFYKFTVNDQGEIEYGLGAVKGVGENVIEQLVLQRNVKPYVDLFDFCQRLYQHKLSRRAIEPLIRAGAMDCLGQNRAVLLATTDRALKAAEQAAKNSLQGQTDLFGGMNDIVTAVDYVAAKALSQTEILKGEKESLGWYLSGHPFSLCALELKNIVHTSIKQLAPTDTPVRIAGVMLGVRHIMTRKGKRMAILTLEDESGRLEVTLFSEILEKIQRELSEATVFLVKGKVARDDYNGGVRMVAEAILSLDQARLQLSKRLLIKVAQPHQVETLLNELPKIIANDAKGKTPISIAYTADQAQAELKLGEEWQVRPTQQLLEHLRELCGNESVVLEY